MKRATRAVLWAAASLALVAITGCGSGDGSSTDGRIGGELILATTTSTQDSGLLDVLIPVFENETGIEVKVIAVGSGAALEMAGNGNADAVLVHSPTGEQKYIDSGDLVRGQLVMHNDFVIVGPAGNPAGVEAEGDLISAMAAIAGNSLFVSRGDNSGTHSKEQALWSAAGLDPATDVQRLEETGQGMGATLQVASQKSGYTLTDRATFLAQSETLDLVIVYEGDPSMLNVYHAHEVNPEKHPKVNQEQAERFVAFMVSPETQQAIGVFKVAEFGQPLFFPDAGKEESEVGS